MATAKQNNGITIAAVGTLVGLILGVIGFFSSYVFVTKAEMAMHQKTDDGDFHSLETQQALQGASMRSLTIEVKEVKLEQKLTNENLNRLLRRSRITDRKSVV